MKITLIVVMPPAPPGEKPLIVQEQPIYERDPAMIYRDCPVCGWWNAYSSESKANMGMASHRQWCKKGHGRKGFVVKVSEGF